MKNLTSTIIACLLTSSILCQKAEIIADESADVLPFKNYSISEFKKGEWVVIETSKKRLNIHSFVEAKHIKDGKTHTLSGIALSNNKGEPLFMFDFKEAPIMNRSEDYAGYVDFLIDIYVVSNEKWEWICEGTILYTEEEYVIFGKGINIWNDKLSTSGIVLDTKIAIY